MLFHMLKKDLIKRKGINSILFIFITLATVFLASSVNNILATTSAVEYYLDYANIADLQMILNTDLEKEDVTAWLQIQKEEGKITSFAQDTLIILQEKNINLSNGTVFDGKGASLFLGKASNDHNKVFDMQGEPISLKEGEIALSPASMKRNELEEGDQVTIELNGAEKVLTIKNTVKDAAYGSDMIGMLHIVINDYDFDIFSKDADVMIANNIMSDDASQIQKAVSNESFTTVLNFVDRSTYGLVYSFDMIMAALLILIGICLILIALLVLRFTLVFTMEEEYQEIGLLKAIGMRNLAIKKLYLMKYFVLVSCGSFIGLLLSFPVSNMMIEGISKNMIMKDSEANYLVNIVCAIIVIILVLLFCYFCTHKLNKVSAISTIRGGSNGERYQKKLGITLAKRKRMPITLYLGINDILSNMKRYAVLVTTFCISFILITIPLNTVNTLKSEEMATKFAIKKDTAVLLNEIELSNEGTYANTTSLAQGMNRVKQEMKNVGYDVELTAVPLYFFKYFSEDEDNKMNIMTLQLYGDKTDYLQYSDGSAPLLDNEVAVSQMLMEDEGWKIGDRIHIQLSNGNKEMIITGTYSDYMQIGTSIRLNPILDTANESMFSYSSIMVDMETDKSQEEMKTIMMQDFPDYKWQTSFEFVNANVGGIQDMVEQLLIPITGLLCGVIMLITLLMERLFITREKGEIAMLKSIGFNKNAIRMWQMIRMSCVVLISMIISIPLSLLSNHFVLKPVFAIMGADITIQVNAMQAYLIYPSTLLIGIILATLVATNYIRSINIREMNNVE